MDRAKIEAEYEEQGKAILNTAAEILKNQNIPFDSRLIKEIEPEDYIIDVCKEEKIDLVVLGCKGDHSKLKRVFLGTVATKVLNEAPCDVFIVR